MVYEYVILSAASDLLRLLYDNTYAIRRSQSSWQMHQVTGRGSIEVPARSWRRSISFVIGGVYDLEGCVNKPVPRPFERGRKKGKQKPLLYHSLYKTALRIYNSNVGLDISWEYYELFHELTWYHNNFHSPYHAIIVSNNLPPAKWRFPLEIIIQIVKTDNFCVTAGSVQTNFNSKFRRNWMSVHPCSIKPI
jgi:hypothetical protein